MSLFVRLGLVAKVSRHFDLTPATGRSGGEVWAIDYERSYFVNCV